MRTRRISKRSKRSCGTGDVSDTRRRGNPFHNNKVPSLGESGERFSTLTRVESAQDLLSGVRDPGACRKKRDEPGQTEHPCEQERDRRLSRWIGTKRVREDARQIDSDRTADELESKDQTERGTLQAPMTRLGDEREERGIGEEERGAERPHD